MQQQQLPETQALLGDLCSGYKKLKGKSFYLDSVKSRPTALLVEAISLLGGSVESFLHKDVSFVVTGSRESPKEPSAAVIKAETKTTKTESHCLTKQRESNLDKPRPGTPRPTVCGSRGKALLEKAIRNNERLKASSVLANAQSWGVKIVYVDDVLSYLKQLTRESFSAKHKRTERPQSRQKPSPNVKASSLRSPYLKVEDSSRKYKPMHMQSMTFPSLYYSGKYSPFASPPPPLPKLKDQAENTTREKKKAADSVQENSPTPPSWNPSPWRSRKKDLAYCESCLQPFTQLEEHLQSDQHRQFVLDSSNYTALDQLVVGMLPGFHLDPSQEGDKSTSPTPPLFHDDAVCELEPLTDAETEDVVQALLIQVPDPMLSPFSPNPASSSPGVQCLTSNPTVPPQRLTPDTDCQLPDSRPRAPAPPAPPAPAAPSLELEEHTRPASPRPDLQSQHPDPYDLPPVLSPQILDPSQVPAAHSPYSDPPALSPQPYIRSDSTETLEILYRVELSRLLCFDGELDLPRSRSLSRLSETNWNPKKRCRSFSLEHDTHKRRRTSTDFRRDASWSGDVLKCFTQSQSAKDDLLFEVSHTGETCRHRDSVLTVEQGGPDSTLVPQVSPSAPNRDPHPPPSHPSVCIEPALIPDLSPSSSESDWDCELLSRLCPTRTPRLVSADQSRAELDKEILQRPCTWMHDTSYESHLHSVLQPGGEEMDSGAFSRTLVQVVEVQH